MSQYPTKKKLREKGVFIGVFLLDHEKFYLILFLNEYMFLLSKTRHCITDSSLIETGLFLYYTPIKAADHSVGLPYTFASNPSVVVPRWRCSSELADNTPQTWEYSIRNLKKRHYTLNTIVLAFSAIRQ